MGEASYRQKSLESSWDSKAAAKGSVVSLFGEWVSLKDCPQEMKKMSSRPMGEAGALSCSSSERPGRLPLATCSAD